ncbi:MAG: hypothetical protein Q9212_001176 [Teloschistes hypoglaucus]
MAHHHGHQALHFLRRAAAPLAIPQPSPYEHVVDGSKAWLPDILVKRGASESSVCTDNDTSGQCGKPSQTNNISLPVALGVVIPIAFAMALFLWLHRRHVRKLRKEDSNDPHKSLDFGIDPSSAGRADKKGRKNPEMAAIDLGSGRHQRGRGLSMDMDMGSPYVLPPGLHSSRESLHSMSRTIHSQDDRYRPATTFIPNDASSARSQSRSKRMADDSSSYAGSGSTGRGHVNDGMNQGLLKNAQRMSTSQPPVRRNPDPSASLPKIRTPEPAASVPRKASPLSSEPSTLAPTFGEDSRDSYRSRSGAELHKSNNYLGALIHSREPSADVQSQRLAQPNSQSSSQGIPSNPAATLQQTQSRKSPPPAINTIPPVSATQRKQSWEASQPANEQNFLDDQSDYGDALNVIPPSPTHTGPSQTQQAYRPRTDSMAAPRHQLGSNTDALGLGYDVRRLSMGFRPLPPDDPTDNPEQRANRIRSFYKEYFDESKASHTHAAGQYYEDYDENFLGDGASYDPTSGEFVTSQPQRSEPYGRRAMTPPPRAPPRFRGGARHHATMSGGPIMPPTARAYSSASGRLGPMGMGAPTPRLPPPGPLRVLPSPHLIKEDSFALPIDFAPPSSYKDRQAGRPDSPKGGSRPYSPMVSAHLPLASSFDDLAVMPSPHSLRKSGTFTALDFAPPPRFKSSDNGSETGSIRSNRSAMSAQQLHSIRAGAYRIFDLHTRAIYQGCASMVYYFRSNVADTEATIYAGKDKVENEELIKHGWDEDFHADNLSSAHIYLRLKSGQEWDKLPRALVEDCAQLTKANSIEVALLKRLSYQGNKKDNVTIVYTPWSNLLKNASMATGQVGFRDQKKTRTILVPTRLNPTINRLMKTRTVVSADGLFAEKEQHLSELRAKAREKAKESRKEDERVKKERQEEKYRREHAYEDMMNGDGDEEGGGKRSNQDGWDDDDFM